MSDNSKIEWCDATWNPVTGCRKVSEGCRNCYAMKFAERWRGTLGHYFENGFDVTLRPEKLDQPLLWKRPRRIFVNSMSDLFHESVDEKFIAKVFGIMWLAQHHTFQILTKRPERMSRLLNNEDFQMHTGWFASQAIREYGLDRSKYENLPGWPNPNIWLGVSVENQKAADERIPLLLQTPAAVRFLSCEPLLGPVRFWPYTLTERPCFVCEAEDSLGEDRGTQSHPINCGWRKDVGQEGSRGIDWIIVGGESGPGARPMHPEWARSLRDQCQAAGVPFHFKQWGEWAPGECFPGHIPSGTSYDFGEDLDDNNALWRVGKKTAGRMLDGRTWDEMPVLQLV